MIVLRIIILVLFINIVNYIYFRKQNYQSFLIYIEESKNSINGLAWIGNTILFTIGIFYLLELWFNI